MEDMDSNVDSVKEEYTESSRRTEEGGCNQDSCSGCAQAGHCNVEGRQQEKIKNKIGKIIAVMSGKGGVGKSFVTASLAVGLVKKGYRVGILDADVTGPSIPKMFGMDGIAGADEKGIYPVISTKGIKVVSVNLLLPDKEEPVLWRGPIIAGVVKQFYSEVYWGELDFLLIDMPPGTGDVPLTVFQSVQVDGVIVVTSPQQLVKMIVKKACHMAQKMEIPVLGVIENFSYLECPDCGKKMEIFGKSTVEEVAEELQIPVLGKLPLVPAFAQVGDEGNFDELECPYLAMAIEKAECLAGTAEAET